MIYILKNGQSIESIPIGRSSVVIGQISKSGFLTVKDRASSEGRAAQVICQCVCGAYIKTKLNNIRNGHTQSCGCKAKEERQERGRTVGSLEKKGKDYTKIKNPFYTFNKQLKEKNSEGFYWDIICNRCGQHYKEVPSQLISEKRRRGNNPCPCWKNQSKGILKIIDLLNNNNINFIQEYTFEDCLSPKGNKMKFDFYLPEEKYLIEYDGEQHFIPSNFGSKEQTGKERLLKQQEYDNIKNQWCKNNNIILIRIPYTQYNILSIEDLKKETSKFKI